MLPACNIFVATGCFRNEFLAGRPSVCEDPSNRARGIAVPRSPMTAMRRRPVPTDPRVRALRRPRVRAADANGRPTSPGGRSCSARPAPPVPRHSSRRAARAGRRRRRRRRRRTTRRATSSSGGPTGRSTSTRTTTPRKYPTLEAFEAKTGIKVDYAEDIEDNDSFYGKINGQLKNGQDIGYDIVTLTDWMAARMIRLGYTQELDKAAMPNTANILPTLANVDFDPGRKHSLDLAVGLRRARLGQVQGAGRPALGRRPVEAGARRAGSRCSRRCATRWA